MIFPLSEEKTWERGREHGTEKRESGASVYWMLPFYERQRQPPSIIAFFPRVAHLARLIAYTEGVLVTRG